MVNSMFVAPLEFARGKDKKRRKKRTELGQNIRTGAKVGALAGAGLYGATLLKNRGRISESMSNMNNIFRGSGLGKKGARRITRGLAGIAISKDTVKSATKGALIGAGTLGVGTAAVRGARGVGVFGSLRNKRKDNQAEARVAKREKRREAKYV